jgi:hypothetical protein
MIASLRFLAFSGAMTVHAGGASAGSAWSPRFVATLSVDNPYSFASEPLLSTLTENATQNRDASDFSEWRGIDLVLMGNG